MAKTLIERLVRWRNGSFEWLVGHFGPPDPRADERYKDALKWDKECIDSIGADACKTLEAYAARKYEETKAAFDSADRKATALFGIGVTLNTVLIGAVFTDRVSFWIALVPLICLFISMFCALRVPLPAMFPGLITIRRAVQHVADGENLTVQITKTTERAIVAMQVVIAWKADLITWSTLLIVAGLLAAGVVLFCQSFFSAVISAVCLYLPLWVAA